jgi:hypothetical protein
VAANLTDAVTAAEARLSIGGVEFSLSAGGQRVRQDVSGPYRSFLSGAPGEEPSEAVRVELEVLPRPTFDGVEIFRSEATWSLFAREGERAFVFREPSSADPLYVARFRPGSRTVSVLCSPRMVGSDDAGRFVESPFRYPLDQILTMYLLAGRGFVIHSAGLILGGRGFVFPGVSGAGKSTFARLAGSRPGWEPLSDDRTVLRFLDGKPVVYGTPWPGEGLVAENRRAPLAGLLFLEKGLRNEVRPIPPAECLSRLFPVVSIPWFDHEVLPEALSACEQMARAVPGAILTFRPEAGAIAVLEAFLGSDSEGSSE